MTNLLGPYMDYIKEGKWNKIEKNILIPKIIDKKENLKSKNYNIDILKMKTS